MDYRKAWIAGATMWTVLTGCGQRLDHMSWEMPQASQKQAGVRDARGPDDIPGGVIDNPRDVLSLEQAMSLALKANPGLAGADLGVRAARAQAFQEGRRPNPELEVEIEEFGGTGGLGGTSAAAASIVLSQAVELGGKRALRSRVAELEAVIAERERDGARSELAMKVLAEFKSVLALQARLALANQMVELSEKTRSAIEERVLAGKAPELEAMQARIEASKAQLQRSRTERELAAAKDSLASLWGASSATFKQAEGDIYHLSPLPELDELLRRAGASTDVLVAMADQEAAFARTDLERANAMPDLGIAGGLQHFSETGDSSFTLGVSVALPISDRGRGATARARFEAKRAQSDYRSAAIEAQIGARRVYLGLVQSREESIRLRDEVLPTAKRALEISQEGYSMGKFDYLEVLAAQQVLVDTHNQYIDALVEYHAAKAELSGLMGTGLESQGSTELEE